MLHRAEGLLDVGQRSEQPFFLAAPEGDADRAPRLDAERLEDARRFHHDGAAHGVIGRAGRHVPGIEVAPEHDDLVLLVAAGNLRDRVVRGVALRIPRVGDVELAVSYTHLTLPTNREV